MLSTGSAHDLFLTLKVSGFGRSILHEHGYNPLLGVGFILVSFLILDPGLDLPADIVKEFSLLLRITTTINNDVAPFHVNILAHENGESEEASMRCDVSLFQNQMLALLIGVVACLEELAQRHEVFSFGDPKELFGPCTLENTFFSVNVVRTLFTGKYHGSQKYSIHDGVLAFDLELPEIKVGFVFIEGTEWKLFEIEQVLTTSAFRIKEIDPLGVFTKLRMSSTFLKQPNLFEGFANFEITGLDFASLDTESRTIDETTYSYEEGKSDGNFDFHAAIFALNVDICGYEFELKIDFYRNLRTISFDAKSLKCKCTREWHSELLTGASFCSLKSNVSEVVAANLHPGRSYFEYDPKAPPKGAVSFNAAFTTNVTVSIRIAKYNTSHTSITQYEVANDLIIRDETTLGYDLAMSFAREFQDFAIRDRLLWNRTTFPFRSVSVPLYSSRKEKLYNESLYEPACQDIPEEESRMVIIPYKLSCDAVESLQIRIDVFNRGALVNSLLLEPINFDQNHHEVDQLRTLTLTEYSDDYVFMVFVRDLNNETSTAYMRDWFTINDTHVVLSDPDFHLNVTVNVSKAFKVEHSKFYKRTDKVDYVYFQPQGGQYSVIRHSSNHFLTNQDPDVLKHEAFMMSHDPTLFWDVSTFELAFVNLTLPESIYSLRLTFNVQLDSSRMEPFYDAIFTQDSEYSEFDDLFFQMTENWALRIYGVVRGVDNEEFKYMMKVSYQKLLQNLGGTLNLDIHGCKLNLNVSSKTLQPVLFVGGMDKFSIAPTYISKDNVTIPADQSYSILRYSIPPVPNFENLSNIYAIMTLSNVTVLSQFIPTENSTLVIKLRPGFNIRSLTTSIIISLPIYSHTAGFVTCQTPMVLGMPDTIFCRQRDAINGSSSCPLGCLEHGHNFGILPLLPQGLEYQAQHQPLAADSLVSISYIEAKTTEPVEIEAYLNDVWWFPDLSAELYGDFADTMFKNFRVQCSRCKSLLTNRSTEVSPSGPNKDIYVFTVQPDPLVLSATCTKAENPFCITKHQQLNLSLLEFNFPYGVTSYTNAIPLENGVIYQVANKGDLNYSRKWIGGATHQYSIASSTQLSLIIHVTKTTVNLTGFIDSREMPFSATANARDPLRFFKALGLTNGSFHFNGTVTGPFAGFQQPKLGTFDASHYDAINLSYVFGFNISSIVTFHVACSPMSPEVEGICTPTEPTPTPTDTPTSTVTKSPSGMSAKIIAIIATSVVLVVIAAAVVSAVFIRRRMTKQSISATGIMSKQILAECEFDI